MSRAPARAAGARAAARVSRPRSPRDGDDGRRYLEAIARIGPAELQHGGRRPADGASTDARGGAPDGAPAGSDETAAGADAAAGGDRGGGARRCAEKPTRRPRPRGGQRRRGSLRRAGRRAHPRGPRRQRAAGGGRGGLGRRRGLEDAGDGAAPAIAALLDGGTRTRRAAAVAAEARALGGRAGGFAGRRHLGLRADFLPQHLARGLALVADCLARPASPTRGRRGRARAAGACARRPRARRRPASGRRCGCFARRSGRTPRGRAERDAPPALGRVRLLDHYRRHYPLSRLVVSVVGNVDPAAVAAALTPRFPAPACAPPPSYPALSRGPLRRSRRRRARPRLRGRARAGRRRPTTVFRALGGTESSAVVGYPTSPAGDADRAGGRGARRGPRAARAGGSRPPSATNGRWPVGATRAFRPPRRPASWRSPSLSARAPRRRRGGACAPRSRASRRPASRRTR